MNNAHAEQLAMDFVGKNSDVTFEFDGKPGHFEVLEDMNCCAPTDNVLFAFQMDGSRKVLSAADLLEFKDLVKKI